MQEGRGKRWEGRGKRALDEGFGFFDKAVEEFMGGVGLEGERFGILLIKIA